MSKKTDSQQSLFGLETQLTASLRTRLKDSWAQLFRAEIFPIPLRSEDQFAMLYGKTGRPNFSVARMLDLFQKVTDQPCNRLMIRMPLTATAQ